MATARIFQFMIVHVTVITEYVCSSGMLRMCYFNTYARYRTTTAKFDIDKIDFSLCTHYIYAYAKIDPVANDVAPVDPGNELGNHGAYKHFTDNNLRSSINTIRMLSVGGPNNEAHNAFSQLTRSNKSMMSFACNAVTFLRKHGFAGLDIAWQSPKNPDLKAGLVRLLGFLRKEFDKEIAARKLLLTVKCHGMYIDFLYNARDIARYPDYVILTSYNLPAPSPWLTSFGSPLYSAHISVNSTVQEWLLHGLPVNKTVVGISAVGRLQKLADATRFTPGSPVLGDVNSGSYYTIPHGLAYPEICDLLPGGRSFFDDASQMHYLVNQDTWVGYENQTSLRAKITWMRSLNIRALMFSDIDQDDFDGLMCKEGKYPLLNFIKAESESSTRKLFRSSFLNQSQEGALTTSRALQATPSIDVNALVNSNDPPRTINTSEITTPKQTRTISPNLSLFDLYTFLLYFSMSSFLTVLVMCILATKKGDLHATAELVEL